MRTGRLSELEDSPYDIRRLLHGTHYSSTFCLLLHLSSYYFDTSQSRIWKNGFSYKLGLVFQAFIEHLGAMLCTQIAFHMQLVLKTEIFCCCFFKWSRILIGQRRCWRKVECEVQAMIIRTSQIPLKFKDLLTKYQQLKLCLTFALGFLVFNIITNFCVQIYLLYLLWREKNWVESLKVSQTEITL